MIHRLPSMMDLNCIQFIGLLLLYQVLDVSSHGGFLKPEKPVRRIGEYLTFHCESPDYYGLKPDIYIDISHNGTALKQLKPLLINSNAAVKAEYSVTDISIKTAGTWECRMTNGEKYSFRQNLIIVQGNSTPALVEDRSTVVIDCLTDEDKTRGVHVKWLLNNEPVRTTDAFSVELKDVSLKDATKNISCIVSQNGTHTDADNEASTSIYKPFSDMKQAESKGSNTGTIVGVAVTVVVFLGFLVGLVICWKRNNLRKCCTATTNEAKTEAQDDASNDAGLPLVTLPQIQQLNGVHTRKE